MIQNQTNVIENLCTLHFSTYEKFYLLRKQGCSNLCISVHNCWEEILLCFAIMELTLIGLKQPLVTSQSQAGRLNMLSQHVSVERLSQNAIAQS